MTRRAESDDPVVETLIGGAYAAATRGDVAELDQCLDRLRAVAPADADALGEELHLMARCVRAHPSFDAAAEAPPIPGRGRAAG